MAFWKQALISLVVIAVVAFGWFTFFPGAQEIVARFGNNESAASGDAKPAATGPGARGGAGGGFGGNRASTVVTRQAGTGVINNALTALGTGVALHAVTVTPRASGTLTEILVSPGAVIKAGDVIAKLDATAQQIAADKAKLALQDAQATMDRYTQLDSTNTITKAQLQTTQLALDNAQLNFRSAELDLQDRSLVAPIDGTIGIIQVDAGNAVTTSTTIATIEDRSQILISYWVPEHLLDNIAVGDPVSAIPVARPQSTVEGKIAAIDNKIDTASGAFEVQASMPNPKDELRAGMSFTVKMSFPGDDFIAVDPLAIQWGSEGAYVWRANGGKAERIGVKIVQRNSESVLVAGDIAEGDPIITEGLDGLRAGGAIQIYGEAPKDAERGETSGTKPAAPAAS